MILQIFDIRKCFFDDLGKMIINSWIVMYCKDEAIFYNILFFLMNIKNHEKLTFLTLVRYKNPLFYMRGKLIISNSRFFIKNIDYLI